MLLNSSHPSFFNYGDLLLKHLKNKNIELGEEEQLWILQFIKKKEKV
jgi:hypothetical protein